MLNNKKAQVGETATWLVATVLIVVMILFFVFGASLLAETKGIEKFKESVFSESIFQGDDIFLRKSLYTYNSVSKSSEKIIIEGKLKEMESQDKLNLPLNETKSEIILGANRE